MLNLCYVYYLSKLTEFCDTIFFVLRKKKTQITWLHLYHHALTPMEAWLLVKFISGNWFVVSTSLNGVKKMVKFLNETAGFSREFPTNNYQLTYFQEFFIDIFNEFFEVVEWNFIKKRIKIFLTLFWEVRSEILDYIKETLSEHSRKK